MKTLIAQILLLAIGPLLAAHGITADNNDIETVVGALVFIGGAIWKIAHFKGAVAAAASTPQTVPVQTGTKGNGMAPTVPLLVLGAVTLLGFTGCVSSPPVVGHVISQTERGFGVIVETTSSPNQTPKVKLGFFSTATVIEPVLSNTVAYIPPFANTFAIQQSISPFDFGVNESIASGGYRTGNPMNSTNSVSAEPALAR